MSVSVFRYERECVDMSVCVKGVCIVCSGG